MDWGLKIMLRNGGKQKFLDFFAVFFLFFFVTTVTASLNLTKEEQLWIKGNTQLIVANEMDGPPFDYTEKAKPAGYSIDVIRLIADKTGLQMKFINGHTRQELLLKFKEGEIDILPAISINNEQRKTISFSKSYYAQPSIIVVHKNNKDIASIESLTNKRVAGVKGYSISAAIKKIKPTVTMVEVSSILDGLKSVSLGYADAFIDSIGIISHLLDNNYIPNLKIINNVEHPALANPALHMGVAKENTLLTNVLDKALASISRDEKRTLENRWFYVSKEIEQSDSVGQLDLSAEQLDWLNKQSKIRIGIMSAWPPMDYVDTKGQPAGIGVEFIKALNRRLDNKLIIIPGLWEDNFAAVKENRLDALMDITPRSEREDFIHFTKPYIEVPHLIYTRKNEVHIDSLADLKGKVVGIEKGFFIVKVLREKYPDIKIIQYRTTSDVLDALSKGEVDAYVGNRAVASYIIQNELITNVIAQGKVRETSSINAIGVRKDEKILRDILQKGLDDISAIERAQIINPDNKLNNFSELKSILFNKLSKKERRWLTKQPTVHLGVDPSWPPIEWIDEQGNYRGMTSDYIKFIADLLGLKFVTPERMAWTEVLQGVKKDKLDILPAVVRTEERSKFLNFTKPYIKFPFVIFTRDNTEFITDIQDLYGKRVGIEEGYSSQEDLKNDHPQLDLVSFTTTKDILYALSVGEIDAYIGNLTVAVYLLKQEGLTNIKVAAPTKYSFELSIGVRKKLGELYTIMDKALSMIDEVQKNEIRQRWLKLNYKVGIEYDLAMRVFIVTIIIFLLILLWLFVVKHQKKIISAAKEESDRANAKLKELDQLKSMFIASVSHELRTPLNAVIGFSSVMMNGLYGELNEKYLDYTTRINKSGQHLLSLITDIIDISKIESGNLDIEKSDFDLDEIVEEAVTSLEQLASGKNLLLTNSVPKGILLHTDKRRLFQTILNFVSNAVKYSEQGEVKIFTEVNNDTVTLTVSDTGVGIDEENMDWLFEPFERFESHISIKAGGTGLGLYLTKKIVTDMLKGEIGAKSKLGEGSSFWIKIPKVL